MIQAAIILIFFVLTSCSNSERPTNSSTLRPSSSSDRIDEVTALLKRSIQIPTKIIEAHYVELRVGDPSNGFDIGPVDYVSYLYVKVPAKDIDKWTSIFTPLHLPPGYTRPDCKCEWWVGQKEFPTLEFFAPNGLSSRIHGWIGVSRNEGKIYLYDYTT